MKLVLVTGGTSSLGKHLLPRLDPLRYRVRVLSRHPRPPEAPPHCEWAIADLTTGQGVADNVAGAQILVHCATRPSAPSKMEPSATLALLGYSKRYGVEHFVYPSVVGIDTIDINYFQIKLRAEKAIESSGVPFSILRCTQFHSFLDRVFSTFAKVPIFLPLPTDFLVQPVDAAEFASRMAATIDAGPCGRVPDFGGPEILTVGDAALAWLDARGRGKRIWNWKVKGAAAEGFRRGDNVVRPRGGGRLNWPDWLRSSARAPNSTSLPKR